MNQAGIWLAMASFLMWGNFPLYWVNTIQVPAFEVLSHRGFWIVPVLIVVATLAKLWPKVRAALAPANFKWLLVSATLIAINWGVYVWAVAEQQVTQAALGYYLTPLLNVAMGMLLFGETLSTNKRWALVLASIGVAAVVLLVGEWPWFALAVGFSFAAYSSTRKMVKVDSIVGLSVESLVLFPIWAIYLWVWGDIKWVTTEPTAIWLILGGAVTAIPLITHVAAARRIPLSLLGMLFFTVPTLQMINGVLVLGEPFDLARAVAFLFIWAAVAIFLLDEYQASRARRALA